ncbi:MAG: PleD family two-component system response regulator [Sulfuricella sp.]|nr:PleD family two-component system response regulator [Sulfuricella sp.]
MKNNDRPLILIVDDTPTNIQILAEALRTEYRVKVATSGKTALELADKPESRPDLILLDVMMPEMDGYEVCRRLKENPATHDIPVIFVTAKSDVTDEEQGLRLGAMDYIVKPFHLAIVKARVENHVNLKIKTDLLESLALIDGLTGIPNRRRFDETLESAWKRAQRESTPLALIMTDIDYFKPYNDNYGHGAGDHCLKTVAKALHNSLARPNDMVARYGGEEFVAVLPDTDAEGARQLAERWCAAIAALKLPHRFSAVADHVTVSAGYAALDPVHGQSPKEFLEMADKMLYRAKEQGRNRVCG